MNKAEATEILRRLEISIAKTRSVLMETTGVEDPDEDSAGMSVLKTLNPRLFGNGSVLVSLHRLNERIRKQDDLTPGEFLNFMWIAEREPVIQVGYAAWGGLPDPHDLSPVKWGNAQDPMTDYEEKFDAAMKLLAEPEPEAQNRSGDKTPTQYGHKTIFDFPHEMETVPMMKFFADEYPLSFMIGGTTVYSGEKEIARVSPWLDGSMAVHVAGSDYAYLVHVGHVLNAVFALEGINIDAFKITGEVGDGSEWRRESASPRSYEKPVPVAYDTNGELIKVGDIVLATITMDEDYFQVSHRIVVFRGAKGVVVEIEEGGTAWVEFERFDHMTEPRMQVFSKHLELAEFADEGDYQ